MEWICLSPHLDDVALSLGGAVWEQVRSGNPVQIWTITAGDSDGGNPSAQNELSSFAQQLHARWETDQQASAQRRREDLESCAILGGVARHFALPDCIYRRHPEDGHHLYTDEEALFGPLDPAEGYLVAWLQAELERSRPAGAKLVCPLALGGHVDHRLTRLAAEASGHPLYYYADYPYARKSLDLLSQMQPPEWERTIISISSDGMKAWAASVAAHTSQVSTFWANRKGMEIALQDHCNLWGGIPLWRRER